MSERLPDAPEKQFHRLLIRLRDYDDPRLLAVAELAFDEGVRRGVRDGSETFSGLVQKALRPFRVKDSSADPG